MAVHGGTGRRYRRMKIRRGKDGEVDTGSKKR